MNSAIDDALEAIRHANPVPDPVNLADSMRRSDVFLTTTKETSMSFDSDRPNPETPAHRRAMRRKRLLAVVGGFAVAAVAIALVATLNTGDDLAPTGASGEPAATATTVLTADDALAVSDDFIERFNTGDADALLAMLTPDVALSENYIGMSRSDDPFGEILPAFFEQHMAWATAQGATFTSPACAVTDDSAPTNVTVLCEFGWLYAPEKAAGDPPVPTALTMVITEDGISQAAFEYPPIFGSESFDAWLLANYSGDMEGVEFGDWNSVSEARQGGILRAQYVDEWAASQ